MSIEHEIKIEAASDHAAEITDEMMASYNKDAIVSLLSRAWDLAENLPEDGSAEERVFLATDLLYQAKSFTILNERIEGSKHLRQLVRKINEAIEALQRFGKLTL